ncbi:hypothetical protein HYT23_00135 [Candidatus Pacearchaeota archaeon]|nr:hypothetical protein [Candidatus Pacearchaeota archaeon]
MNSYRVYHSSRFDKELNKFDTFFQGRVDKIEEQLRDNPYTGDPLGTKWFREKRVDKYRVYYLVYDDLKAVFMVAISEKKDQQKIINTIRLFFDFFRDEIEKLISEEDLT